MLAYSQNQSEPESKLASLPCFLTPLRKKSSQNKKTTCTNVGKCGKWTKNANY